MQTVWVSVYPHDPARQATGDEAQCRPVVPEWYVDEPYRVSAPGLCAGRAHLGSGTVPQTPMRSQSPQAARLYWNSMRCDITSRKSAASSGAGKHWIATRDNCSTGNVGGETSQSFRRWSPAWPNGTCRCTAQTRGPRMLRSCRRRI
jgi:hypothetical protein